MTMEHIDALKKAVASHTAITIAVAEEAARIARERDAALALEVQKRQNAGGKNSG